MKKTIVSLLFITLGYSVIAQEIPMCGFDIYRQELLKNQDGYKRDELQADQLLYKKAIQNTYRERNASVILTVPVVVHVMHLNGPENIPDSSVIAAINELNLRFQNAAPYYDATGHDMQIQFCLASVDPYGNSTTGITRTYSECTNLGSTPTATETNMKNLARWEPYLYMNVWIINSMPAGSNVVGYATYPSAAGSSIDGIVMMHDYLNNSYVLAHEAGHYLGLHHTWLYGCVNFNCQLDGDQVCDTPPDANVSDCNVNSCSTDTDDTTGFSPFVTDVFDLPNYMDYTTCPLSFSQGQGERMYNALTTLRPQLLLSNGCGQNPGGVVPSPSFTVTNGCPHVIFNNTSTNGVGAAWDFNLDGQVDAAGNYVTYAFPVSGYYDVKMYSFGYGGMDSVIQNVFVLVRPYQNYPIQNVSGVGVSIIEQQMAFCLGSVVTIYGEPGMVSYSWSTGDTTQNISFTPTTAFNITLTVVDSGGFTWTSCSPAQAVPVPAAIPPVLSVISNDTIFCMDDLWSQVTLYADFSPLMLFNTWYGPNAVIPNFHDSILTATLSGIYNTFFVNQIDSNGCHSTSNVLHMDLDYVPFGLSITQSGDTLFSLSPNVITQWYLDGIPIPGAIGQSIVMSTTGCYAAYGWYTDPNCGIFTDTVCHVMTAVQEIPAHEKIVITPNPVNSIFHVQNKTGPYILYDATGRQVQSGIIRESDPVDISWLPEGIYLLRMDLSVFRVIKIQAPRE